MSKFCFQARNLRRAFGPMPVLRGIDLDLPRKGMVGIVGPSGSGKSTLLNILSGLDDGYAGKFLALGKDYKKMGEGMRRRFRLRYVGYVFQNFRLLELETVEGNVMAIADAIYKAPKVKKKRKVHDLLSFFGLEKKAKQKTNTLSGGEKQRVALARALCNDPKVLLCDEPTGALDAKRSEEVFSLLRRISSERLVVVVSHDEELTRRYCDEVLTIRDGVIKSKEKCAEQPKESPPRSFFLHERKPTPRLSIRFLLSHAFQAAKAKKWRSLISEAAISIGLSGLGLATYTSSSISDELSAAFGSLVPPNALVMMPRGGNDSPIGAVYGAGLDECEYIVEEYGDMVRDYGTDLHMDYESWFIDRNDFTYSSGVETVRLDDFSVRSINDFRWLDNEVAPMVYPRTPAILYADQIVLGLPYQNMFTTCLNLHILRDYQSLGDYIDAHGLTLCLNIANYEIGFDDQELFSVVGVVETETPCIFHLDHRWNRKIFLDQLRFRSSLTEETPNPQWVFEIPFISLTCPVEDFVRLARRDENLGHLIYERGGYAHNPSIYQNPEELSADRLFLYGADKTGVGFSTLDECMAVSKDIVGREPVTQASYYAESSSVVMGFAQKFFLCQDEDKATQVIDAYSDLPRESAFLPGEEIEGVKDGSVFGMGVGGLRISSDLSGPMPIPIGVEECLVSVNLYEAWGKPKEVYVAAEIGAEEVGANYVRRFGRAALKVVGTRKCDYDTLFVADDWTVDFFLSLGVSSFALEPYGAVFSLREGCEPKEVVATLEKNFPNYEFTNPAEEIASSIETTLSYVGTILTAFSFIALAMSALLFLIVMTITIGENKSESELFHVLGLSKGDVIRVYCAYGGLYGGVAIVGSLVTVTCSAFFTQLYLANSFHTRLALNVPFSPLLTVVVAGVVFTAIIMLGISINLLRKK